MNEGRKKWAKQSYRHLMYTSPLRTDVTRVLHYYTIVVSAKQCLYRVPHRTDSQPPATLRWGPTPQTNQWPPLFGHRPSVPGYCPPSDSSSRLPLFSSWPLPLLYFVSEAFWEIKGAGREALTSEQPRWPTGALNITIAAKMADNSGH